jgi:hypothetical protein
MLFSCLLSVPFAVAQEKPLPTFSVAFSDSIVFEIDPRIELLAGVQSKTSWVTGGRGPGAAPNPYYRDLAAFFAPYSQSAAMKDSEALLQRGFAYDAPAGFALSLEPGLTPPEEGWTAYLAKRAGSKLALDGFARSMAELSAGSGFASFLARHEAEYRAWLDESTKGIEPARLIAWMAEFYGFDASRYVFHFTLASALFPRGGYSFTRSPGKGRAGKTHIYQIVLAGAQRLPTGNSLASLGLHEFGHSFVNPAVGANPKAKDLTSLFLPVQKRMAAMAYTGLDYFLNELVLRAATIIGQRELGYVDPSGVEALILVEESAGFYPIRRTIALLEEYRARRSAYPDFASYAPVLLDGLAEYARENPSPASGEVKPVFSFSENFDSVPIESRLPVGFSNKVGSRIAGRTWKASGLGIEREGGAAFLRLSADDSTEVWYCPFKPIEVKQGRLFLRYRAKGEGIHTAQGQFGGTYAGFILTGVDGKNSFQVVVHAGSFAWGDFSLEHEIDPKKVKSILFQIFLNESGVLSVDDIEVGYR